MIQKGIKALKEFIEEPKKKVVIISHPRPDADALGSSLAVKGYLEQYGHHVDVLMPTESPMYLSWIKGFETVQDFSDESQKAALTEAIIDADLICVLDFSKLNRVGELGPIIASSKAKKLVVDHHLDPDDFADFVYWSSDAAATCELLFDLFSKELDDAPLVNVDMAEALYAGIMTDTGSFGHPTTTAKIHRIVSKLMEIGVNNAKIHQMIFKNQSEDRVKFLGHVLSRKLTVLHDYRTAYITVSKEELEQFNSQEGDTEGVVDYALSIRGVVFAILAIDRGSFVKFSFRSVGTFDVKEFANQHFNGGGHKNASGGSLDGVTAEEAVKAVEKVLPNYKNELMTIETAI